MTNPKISIITVVWNAAHCLEQTILSVINQSYQNIEYIIIDGQSTDGTIEIIKKYGHKLAYWISEKDEGIYDAMNKGIDIAKGDWVYFLGAGDILFDIIQQIAQELKFTNGVYYGDVYKQDEHKLYDGKFTPFKLVVKNICQQAIFYPLYAIKKYPYQTQYKTLADHNLNMQLYGDKDFCFIYIPVLVSIYNGGGYSAVNSIDELFFKDKLQIIKANFTKLAFCYAYLRKFLAGILNKSKF